MALMPVAEALERVLTGAVQIERENVGLRFALGRTLGAPVFATLTQPPFDASAMDGYAVRAADASVPGVGLMLVGEAAAGRAFDETVKSGEAVRIFTGAPVPKGADAVLIQEDARSDGQRIGVLEAPPVGANIRQRGQDFSDGARLFDAGRRLGPRDILLAAAAGHATLPVVRKPIVAILATGNELVEPGEPLGPDQIVSSNSYGLAALVEAAGGAPQIMGIADDTMEDLKDALRTTHGADILVTTGGASVGDHDLVWPALEASGAHLELHKIAMRPGKPLFFGTRTVGGKLQRCLGLPGNPVSALITGRVFLVPLIGALLGRQPALDSFEAQLAIDIPANGPRDHYMRATLDRSGSPPLATPIANQDSSRIAALREAECLVVVPANAPALRAGTKVSAINFDF